MPEKFLCLALLPLFLCPTVSEKDFVMPSLALWNLVLVVATSSFFKMFLLWPLTLLTVGISVLGGGVLAWVCCRGVETRLPGWEDKVKAGGSTRKQKHHQCQLLFMHCLFMPKNLCQGPDPAYANQGGALSKLAPVFKAGVSCTG